MSGEEISNTNSRHAGRRSDPMQMAQRTLGDGYRHICSMLRDGLVTVNQRTWKQAIADLYAGKSKGQNVTKKEIGKCHFGLFDRPP